MIYKDTDGLYGGATIGGAQLKVQNDRIAAAYGANVGVADILSGKAAVPDYAARLYQLLQGQR